MLRRSRGRSESSDQNSEEISEWLPAKVSKKQKKGPRKPEEEKWTRILKFDQFMNDEQPVFSIIRDLNKQNLDSEDDDFYEPKQEGVIVDFDMSKSDLVGSFQKAARLIEQSNGPEEDDMDEQADIKRIDLNRKFERNKLTKKRTCNFFPEELSMDQKHIKKRRLKDLNSSQKIAIVHKIRIEHFSYYDAAVLYHVTPCLVGKLVKNSQKDSQFLTNLYIEEENKTKTNQLIAKVASRMYSQKDGIKRSADLVKELEDKENLKITNRKAIQVMKESLDLHYKPLKRIAFQANSQRCLIQRQRFAKEMIDLLLRGQIVLNIDESWLNLKDYTRFRWRQRGSSNSSNVQTISPRISLITALDTRGQVYFSLTQVNTDSDVKCLFLSKLASFLDTDRPGWRENTTILMDNASYNRSDETAKQIKRLGLKVMFSAPYAYDASPIEYFFGYLKQGILMQQGVPSGKQSFHNVVNGVIDRMRQMREAANVMFWHNICKSLYEYLHFKRL